MARARYSQALEEGKGLGLCKIIMTLAPVKRFVLLPQAYVILSTNYDDYDYKNNTVILIEILLLMIRMVITIISTKQ